MSLLVLLVYLNSANTEVHGEKRIDLAKEIHAQQIKPSKVAGHPNGLITNLVTDVVWCTIDRQPYTIDFGGFVSKLPLL
jgi:hypothetical protein